MTITVPPLLFLFETILRAGPSHDGFQDSKDWRDCKYSCHVDWVQPLLEDGRIREARVEPAWKPDEDTGGRARFNYHYFAVTEKGLKWWLSEYTKEIGDRAAAYQKLIEPSYHRHPQLDGHGIGAVLRYDFWWEEAPIAMAAIEDGYFEFESFHYYPRGSEKSLYVKLTAKGMHYFDSLPRLVEVF